jgi:hypothetical protein
MNKPYFPSNSQPIPAEEFNRIKKREEFIRQTAAQIQKDFAEFSIQIHFSGNTQTAYDELFAQVATHLAHLLETSSHRLSALIYRIDLSQKQIDDHLRQFPQAGMANGLADLIIQRELKKVLIRNYFKETASTVPDIQDITQLE